MRPRDTVSNLGGENVESEDRSINVDLICVVDAKDRQERVLHVAG